VPREDMPPAPANAPGQATAQEQAAQQQAARSLSALTDQERLVLDVLMTSQAARTVAQLSAASGLSREQVAIALDSLRVQGLVTQFNTLIESYGARFPGLELR
jgi:DNA-directed RNA polymerase sigma subunit (sigma70/sigma32)